MDRTLKAGEATVVLERCQSGVEGLTVRFTVQPPDPVVFRLSADGSRLDVVEQEVDPASGKGTVKAYPLLRAHKTLRIEVAGKARGKSQDVTLTLS